MLINPSHAKIRSLTKPWLYVMDFDKAGKAVLAGKRLALFRAFYCDGKEYHGALKALGLRESTGEVWCEEIMDRVGKELERRGIHPPKGYFREPHGMIST